jgi:GNAT superfamily N-acetyltransferase
MNPPSPVFSFRQAGPGDAAVAGASVHAAFERYREFAPPFWRPPELVAQVERLRGLLSDGLIWCVLAETDEGEGIAGQVSFVPADAARGPAGDEPHLAHLSGLFVEPRWWGSGVAATLHDKALAEAARRGYTSMRLFTPAGQARARRFYEREGWAAATERSDVAAGLPTVEYRRGLG